MMGARLVFGQGRFSVRGPGQGISGAPESPRCLRGFRRVDQAKRIHAVSGIAVKHAAGRLVDLVREPKTSLVRKPIPRRMYHPIKRHGAELGRITPRAFAALNAPYKTAPDSRTRHGLPSHRRVDQAKRIHAVSGIGVMPRRTRSVRGIPVSGLRPKTFPVRKPAHRCTS